MFEVGFLGTRAPFFMDLVTLFFGLLPFLVAGSIVLAVKNRPLLHIRSQVAIFIVTLIMVVIFEIGVRVDGGFNAYMTGSGVPYGWALLYLIVHIIVALLTVVAWGITIYSSYKAYREEGITSPYFAKHKKRARWIFLAIIVTSIMGCLMYPILFIL